MTFNTTHEGWTAVDKYLNGKSFRELQNLNLINEDTYEEVWRNIAHSLQIQYMQKYVPGSHRYFNQEKFIKLKTMMHEITQKYDKLHDWTEDFYNTINNCIDQVYIEGDWDDLVPFYDLTSPNDSQGYVQRVPAQAQPPRARSE